MLSAKVRGWGLLIRASPEHHEPATTSKAQRNTTVCLKSSLPYRWQFFWVICRIALNKLNGIDLTKTTVDFDHQIGQFRNSYQRYEQIMSHIAQTDCQDKPADFYMDIERARYYRGDVRKAVVELEKLTAKIGRASCRERV